MFYNSHIHLFKDEDVPDHFLPFGLVKILRTTFGYDVITAVLRRIIPFTDKDLFDRYAKFITIGKLGSQEIIFKRCKIFYPEDTRFIVLAMDMAYMKAGKVPRKYEDQLIELGQLKDSMPQIIPFMHVDPRRTGVLNLLKKSVEELGFQGVKLYPPLGYFPYDTRLYPIYEYCEEMDLPIITHCSPYGPVHYKGKKKDLIESLREYMPQIEGKGKNNKELCSYFINPLNYIKVIEKFKKLRICFAHFGSDYYWDKYIHHPDEKDNWFSIICELVSNYENFYTDVSFTLNNPEYFSLLKVLLADDKLRNKILFGSDYYMVETEADERRFGLDLRAFIGEDYFRSIAIKNPKAFLGV